MLLKKSLLLVSGLVVLLTLFVGIGNAAPTAQASTCIEDYTVQSGDWLSTIAQKYFGEVLAYTAIVNATNTAAQDNERYTVIANPNQIEVGQVLCIPPGEEAQAMLAEPVAVERSKPVIPTEEMLIIVGNRTHADIAATITLSGGEFGEEGEAFTLEAGQEIRFELPSGDYQAAWTSPNHQGFGRKFVAYPGQVALSWIVPEKDYVYTELLDPGNRDRSQFTPPSVMNFETPYLVPADGKSLLVAGNRSLANIPSTLTISGGQFGDGQDLTINPRQEVMIAMSPGEYQGTWATPAEVDDVEPFSLSLDFIVTGGKVGVIWIVPEDSRAFLQRPGEPGQELKEDNETGGN